MSPDSFVTYLPDRSSYWPHFPTALFYHYMVSVRLSRDVGRLDDDEPEFP